MEKSTETVLRQFGWVMELQKPATVFFNISLSVHVIFSDRKPSPFSPTAFIKNETTTKNPFSILKKIKLVFVKSFKKSMTQIVTKSSPQRLK